MNTFEITLDGGRNEFRPNELIKGNARWHLTKAPRAIELHLFTYTQGKGDRDTSIYKSQTFEHAGAQESRAFQFELPFGPYSFSGKLISLCWAIELVAIGTKEIAQVDFTLSPTGKEIVIINDSSQ